MLCKKVVSWYVRLYRVIQEGSLVLFKKVVSCYVRLYRVM